MAEAEKTMSASTSKFQIEHPQKNNVSSSARCVSARSPPSVGLATFVQPTNLFSLLPRCWVSQRPSKRPSEGEKRNRRVRGGREEMFAK